MFTIFNIHFIILFLSLPDWLISLTDWFED